MKIKLISFLIISASLLSSCCKTTVIAAADENELITRVQLSFNDGTSTQTFVYNDPDGDGGNPPIKFDVIKLAPNKSYTMTIQMYDDSKTPVVDATAEINQLKEEHLFIYTPTPANLFTYTYGDKDANGFPVGLTGTIKTNASATGKMKVQLRHQPPVNGIVTKNGTLTVGSDDLNLDFNFVVQ